MSDVNEPQRRPAAGNYPEPPPFDEDAVTPEPAYAAEGDLPVATGPIGEIRRTEMCLLLSVVTLGFYSWYWYYKTHEEMKRHTGEGIGGAVALILAIFVGFVMPFFSSHEVGELYARRGEEPPVRAVTGLWALLLGWLLFIGIIVWFVKTNRALNEYWRSLGAPEPA